MSSNSRYIGQTKLSSGNVFTDLGCRSAKFVGQTMAAAILLGLATITWRRALKDFWR
jgi:hypothetical protein